MKKLFFLGLMLIGFNGVAQQIGTAPIYAPTLMYTPGMWGSVYTIDGVYANSFMIEAQLRTDPQAHSLWTQGNGNIVGGSVLLYPSAFVFGWGLGSISWDDAALVYIGAGGAGMIAGYMMLAKGWEQKTQAILTFNRNKANPVSFNLKPHFSNDGAGIAITF